jgi:hypothetical protein
VTQNILYVLWGDISRYIDIFKLGSILLYFVVLNMGVRSFKLILSRTVFVDSYLGHACAISGFRLCTADSKKCDHLF